jgi:uncharacterized membrane protein YphA (DoxX/SURF4 family)
MSEHDSIPSESGMPPAGSGIRSRIWGYLGNGYLLLALRLIVGLTLVFSGVGKLPDQAAFVHVVQAHGILPGVLADFYGYLLPWLELIAGTLLVLGLFTRFASAVTVLMVASFLIANGTAVYSRVHVSDTSCGCFRWITMKTGDALIVDVVLILFSFLLLLQPQKLLSLDRVLRRMYRMDEPVTDEPPAERHDGEPT